MRQAGLGLGVGAPVLTPAGHSGRLNWNLNADHCPQNVQESGLPWRLDQAWPRAGARGAGQPLPCQPFPQLPPPGSPPGSPQPTRLAALLWFCLSRGVPARAGPDHAPTFRWGP